jgi:hypothetical protein
LQSFAEDLGLDKTLDFVGLRKVNISQVPDLAERDLFFEFALAAYPDCSLEIEPRFHCKEISLGE